MPGLWEPALDASPRIRMNTTRTSQIPRTVRSHTCGELSAKQLGQEVQLCGWVGRRRDHGGLVFIDLRDRYGLTQVVFDPTVAGANEAHQLAGRLRGEFVLWCKG